MVIDSIFDILRKREDNKKWGIDFEIGDIGTSTHLYFRLKKVSYKACLLFDYFFGDKKIAFKSSFNPYFHLFIIEFFWFAYLQFRIEEKVHIKILLLMCLEALGEGLSCFHGRDWEGVCRKILSVVKLYQRFWIWNVDQNLKMALLIVAVCIVLF